MGNADLYLLMTWWLAALLLLALGLICILFPRNRRYRDQRDQLMHEKENFMGFVHDIGEVFADMENVGLEPLLQRALFFAMRTTGAGAGAVYMLDRGGKVLRPRAIVGLMPPLSGAGVEGLAEAVSKSRHLEKIVHAERIALDQGLVGEVAATGQSLQIPLADMDERIPRYQEPTLKIKSMLLAPMRFQHATMGVIVVINRVDGRPFSQENLDLLQGLADQASASSHYIGLKEELEEKQRIDNDLEVARHIQAHLLPNTLPAVEGMELAAFNEPAREIGGDYYDVVRVDDHHIGVVMADVSGKGIAGAILMSGCRGVLRSMAQGQSSPAELLKALNRVMTPDMAEDMFITMLYAMLDTRTHEVALARAGHVKPMLYRGNGGAFEQIDSAGIAIGLADEDMFAELIEEKRLVLGPEDMLILYTDGITEAMNSHHEEWGVEAFTHALTKGVRDSAEMALEHVREELREFMGELPLYDDMTLVILRNRK